MPLYLDDFFETAELGFFPQEVICALMNIKEETANVAITPHVAWSCIKRHLLGLLPLQHQEKVAVVPVRSWRSLFSVYSTLLGGCDREDQQVVWIAKAIDAVIRHSSRPLRNVQFPAFIEVTYFLNSCDHLKLGVRKLVKIDPNGNAEVFHFCKYCWRIAMANRQICPVHAPGKNLGSMLLPKQLGLEAQTTDGRYKEATRQKSKFDAEILIELGKEIHEFHDRDLDRKVLVPDQNWCEWLALRRPTIWSILVRTQQNLLQENLPNALLNLFHNSSELSDSVRPTYQFVNRLLADNPNLMWPMLLRAECWFNVRLGTTKRWGGLRANSGRKLGA